jgi:hypothetical protein
MRYGDKVVPDFAQLVKILLPSAVASPWRSTAHLVNFWQRPESRLASRASRGRPYPAQDDEGVKK